MKKLKIFAVILSVGLLFTSCSNKDKDNNTSSEGVVSSIVSGTESVVSGIESEGDKIVSGTESNLTSENSKMESGTESNLNSTSGKLDTPAMQNMADVAKVDYSALSKLDNTKHGWGQGKDVDDSNRPTSCLSYQEKYQSENAYFIQEDTKNIYLTFDEGYENGYTSKILDVLKEKKCPAVFFVTGPYIKENPDLIKRMIEEGHVVGNHTVNHPSMPAVSSEKAASEIAELHQQVKEKFQYTMTLFRPPMGEWSDRTLNLTKQLGYKTVFWSFAYEDWKTDNQPDPSAALEKLKGSAHNGAIYLLHAVSSTNAAILGDFIDSMRNDGYTFSKLS
jgi:peptidoglycan-N-acetylmuramic acid deacetylase